MRKLILLASVGLIVTGLVGCKNGRSTKDELPPYPNTPTDSTYDNYFGVTVKDPYRWLEQMDSDSTRSWIARENAFSKSYFNKIPYLSTISKRLREVWNYTRYSAPFKKGNETYYFKNDGLQKHDVLYRKTETSEDEEFLTPNTFSKDGTTSLANLYFSHNGQLLAYTISEGGSDWRKAIVIDVYSKQPIGDTLKNIKFSRISWDREDTGFFYSTYGNVANPLAEKTSLHTLYYHRLNTPQRDDIVIFGGSKNPFRYVYAQTTEDRKYLVVEGANSTYGNTVFIKKLDDPLQALTPIVAQEKNEFHIVHSEGNSLWARTDYEAPNSRLVKLTYGNFSPSAWETIIPETNMPLHVTTGHGLFFAHYLQDAASLIKQYRPDGQLDHEIVLPAVGTAKGFSGNEDDTVLYFSFTNYTTAHSIYEYDPTDGSSKLYQGTSLDYDPNAYVSEQVFYRSKDSTRIPMTISYKKGMERNGKNPLSLYGYGGFNLSVLPRFSASNLVWMERGGILAVPNIRGGGEYGKKWHDSGIQMKKQNVFDDFIAAAEYLIEKRYTSTPYLAIEGVSNGGLLIGACMTQRPDLFRVALPVVGVLDMLRYHQFTAGAGWAYDYGTAAQNKSMFEYLLNYSPVHNVADACYPATLVTTADHDDRVVPAHSYKFAAQLQAHQQCDNPALIVVETKAGHGAGKAIDQRIEEHAKKWAFIWWNMGFRELP